MQKIDLTATATTQIEWLRSRKVTAVQLLQAYIDHYKLTNPPINAIINTEIESAMAQAKSIDMRRENGEQIGPLQGLPMTIKDTFDVDGMPAVSGFPGFVDRSKATDDAYVAKCVRDADGIIWGKTNAPLFGGDIQTYNDVYGVTNNPHDLTRTPGGSSGGSAATLASHMGALEIGSDIGGSLRTPSHYCGLYTIKPTWGIIPLQGHVPPPPGVHIPDADLAVAGPIARSMEDLDLLFQLLAPDAPAPGPIPELAHLKVAVHEEKFFTTGQEVTGAIKKCTDQLSGAGASVTVDKPDFDGQHLMDIYIQLLTPIMTADLPKKVRRSMKWMKPISSLLARRGEMSLHNTIKYAYFNQTAAKRNEAKQARQLLKNKCDAFFEKYDILISPVTAMPAIPHNNKGQLYSRKIDVDGNSMPYMKLFQWIALATTCHLPALVIPIGRSKEGLPIGVQIIGKEGSDRRLIEIGKMMVNLV